MKPKRKYARRGTGLVSQEVPAGTLDVAKNRVRVHLQNMGLIDYSLEALAVNCYLQGSHDMCLLFLTRPDLVDSLREPDCMDFQI